MTAPVGSEPRRVLITGALKRMGLGIALALGRQGFLPILHGRVDGADAEAARQAFDRQGLAATLLFGDLTDPATPQRLAAAVGPTLYGLINNASHFAPDDLASLSPETFINHQRINVLAPLMLVQALQAALGRAGGSIIQLLDHNIENPNIDFLSYKLSRFAMAGGVRILARALAPAVRVNGIAPGLTLPSPFQQESDFADIHDQVPLRRGSAVDDIAAACLYLLNAKAVTGQILFVDGGERFLARLRDVSIAPPRR